MMAKKGTRVAVACHEYDIDRQFYVIHLFEDLMPETDYSISLEFTAILNDDLSGFYRSKYVDALRNNSDMWLAVTHFQPGNH